MMEKTPPLQTYSSDFGAAFQVKILATILRSPGVISRYRSTIDSQYFSADANQAITEAILSEFDNFKVVPTKETLCEALKEFTPAATLDATTAEACRLFEVSIVDAASVTSKLVAFAKTQAMCNAVVQGAESIRKGRLHDVRGFIDKAMLVGQDVTNLGTSFHDFDRLSMYTDPAERFEIVPTRLTHVDTVMQGGPRRGEHHVILAPPKTGKTTLLINIGYGAVSNFIGLNVLHVSLEMHSKKILRRYDDRLMGSLIQKRTAHPQWYVDAIKKRLEWYAPGNLFVRSFPTRTATTTDIRGLLVGLAGQGYPIDVLITDYATIVKPTARLGEYRHEIAGVHEQLRGLADEFNLVSWSAAQSTRSAIEKEILLMGDAGESGEISHVVDGMWALCQTPEERMEFKCRLFASALRDMGMFTTVNCDIHRDRCLITTTGIEDAAVTPSSADSDKTARPKLARRKKPKHSSILDS